MYCTELEVLDDLGLTEEAKEERDRVSNGDTIDLDNKFLIDTAFPDSSKTVILTVDGTEESTSDYTVNKRKGTIDYSGSNDGKATIEYKHSPIPNEIVKDKINAMEQRIDEETNTTFEGVVTITDEVYDGQGPDHHFYPLRKRPVDSVSSVEVNEADPTDTDDWKTRDSGRSNDFIVRSNIGIEFLDPQVAPTNDPANLRVTYDYGHSNVPNEINRLTRILVIVDLSKDSQYGAIVEGRDNFDPETLDRYKREADGIMNRWTIDRYDGFVTVATRGT